MKRNTRAKGEEFITHDVEWLIHPLTRLVLTSQRGLKGSFLGVERKRTYSCSRSNQTESKGNCHASQTDFDFFYLDDSAPASGVGRYFYRARCAESPRFIQRAGLG